MADCKMKTALGLGRFGMVVCFFLGIYCAAIVSYHWLLTLCFSYYCLHMYWQST